MKTKNSRREERKLCVIKPPPLDQRAREKIMCYNPPPLNQRASHMLDNVVEELVTNYFLKDPKNWLRVYIFTVEG
jgi:hypothetical protein